MEVADLPVVVRLLQRALDPRELGTVRDARPSAWPHRTQADRPSRCQDHGKLQRGRYVGKRQIPYASRAYVDSNQQQNRAQRLHVRTVLYFLISQLTDASRPSSRCLM